MCPSEATRDEFAAKAGPLHEGQEGVGEGIGVGGIDVECGVAGDFGKG